jgi:hypothetical protein
VRERTDVISGQRSEDEQDHAKDGTDRLRYRIIDSGAIGGVIVSPLGLQEGAQKVAAAENIVEVHLDENSTPEQFVMSFLDKIMLGVVDTIKLKDEVKVEVVRCNS